MSKIKEFLRTHKYAYAILVFIPLYACYFALCRIREPVWTVHSPVDDLIPFVPAFIYFYFLWYLFISIPLIWLAYKSRTDFLRLTLYLVIGMIVCHAFFLILPSTIDFRVQAEAEIAGKPGLTAFLCRFIYASDLPRNVFPSMHCFESVAIHIVLCHGEAGRKYRRFLYPVSLFCAVMICVSTVFIKQHSFYDVIGGVALAFILLPVVYIPKWKFLQNKDSAAVLQGADQKESDHDHDIVVRPAGEQEDQQSEQ